MWGSSTSRSAEPKPKPEPEPEASRGSKLPRRRLLPRWASIGLAAALLVAGAWGAANSPVFRARSIEVSGASHLSRAEVLRVARIAPGTNVLWLDAGATARRLEADQWIASATVTRKLPSTVRIAVTERLPAAEVKVGSGWAVVAADGTVLERVSADPGLPSLVTTLGDRRLLAGSASVVGGMSPWLRARVRSVAPAPDGSLVVELSSGIRVLFGLPSDISVKDQALAGIVRWAASSGAAVGYVDLRAPLAPAVGPGQAPPTIPKGGATPRPAPTPTSTSGTGG